MRHIGLAAAQKCPSVKQWAKVYWRAVFEKSERNQNNRVPLANNSLKCTRFADVKYRFIEVSWRKSRFIATVMLGISFTPNLNWFRSCQQFSVTDLFDHICTSICLACLASWHVICTLRSCILTGAWATCQSCFKIYIWSDLLFREC